MLILVTILFFFLVALALVVLNWLRPKFRYTWLIAAVGTLFGWLAVLTWQFRLPLKFHLVQWQPTTIFLESISFTADSLSWPFAFSIATIIFAVILTAVARENFPAPIPWAATLVLGGLGLLAVIADNPLTLLMVWAAIDLTEIIAQLRSAHGPQLSDKVVAAFAARVAGIGMLLWASMVSINLGAPMDFQNAPPQAGLYLLIAAGLRLGVLPLHLPYASESAIRRGFGTSLRLVSAAASLILLARIPPSSADSVFTPYLLSLVALAAVYGGWMWLRSPNELAARPFWLIGLASLAMASALRGNPVGATAWSCALLLSGSALFLSSAHHIWLARILWISLIGITGLPFTLTATGWGSNTSSTWFVWPFLVLAQALLLAGYLRHSTRSTKRESFKLLDRGAKIIHPFGIAIPIGTLLLLGFWGWEGAQKTGPILPSLVGVIMGGIVLWLAPRQRIFTPVQPHWVRPAAAFGTDWFFRGLSGLYQGASRLSKSLSEVLESDGGFMWTILFIVLFISLLTQGTL